MIHRKVLITPILTHSSILLMVSLIMTLTFEHQFNHDVLSTEGDQQGSIHGNIMWTLSPILFFIKSTWPILPFVTQLFIIKF